MLSHARVRFWHEWKLRQIAWREYASRQRGFIINPYAYGTGGGSPTDPDFASVISLLPFDGTDGSTTFTDIKGKTWTALAAGPALDTTISKYGTASLYSGNGGPGTATGLTTADHADWDFGSGAFSIQFWYRQDLDHSNFPVLINKKTAVNVSPFQIITISSDHSIIMRCSTDGSSYGASISSSASAFANDVWYFWEMTRSSNTLYAFLDGVSLGTASLSGSLTTNTDSVTIMDSEPRTNGNDGYMDDFRVTKGVARNTSNYTPPTAAFPTS